jgi:large subunit ribosomal protein L24
MKLIKTTNLKIGDYVEIISGDNKGKKGNIIFINKKNSTASLDSIEPRVKSLKNRQGNNNETKELPIQIHTSNIMLWDKDANKSSRIGYKLINNEKKRYFKKSGNLT